MANEKLNERQEELKRLLILNDFKEETYDGLGLQEVIILKNSAKMIQNQDQVENAKVFFEKKEDFFRHIIMKRIQKLETLFVMFSKVTNLPYVNCDEESLNDQVWIYSNELFAKHTIGKLQKENTAFFIIKLENNQFLSFFTSLFAMGINEIVLDRDANSMTFELGRFVKQPDYASVPEEKRPVVNPELLLTACYYAQGKALPEEQRKEEELKDLEEEMLANLVRGKVLVPVVAPEGDEKLDIRNLRIPFLKLPNGDVYQPICADQAEFIRFNKDQKLRSFAIDGSKLKDLIGNNAKGVMLNPATLRMAVPKQKL